MAYRTVKIEINTINNTIDVSRMVAKKSDKIKWSLDKDYPFTVEFGWDTPFEEEKYAAYRTNTEPFRIPYKTLRADAGPHGRRIKFKYTIAIYVPKNPNSAAPDWTDGRIWTLDPEIIIDP